MCPVFLEQTCTCTYRLLQVIDDFKNKKAATFDRKQHLQEVKGEACQWTIESIADCLQHSDKLKRY